MLTYVLAVEGLDKVINGIEDLPPAVRRNAVRAINKTTTQGRTLAARAIRDQVAFAPSYLAPAGGRLTVAKKATQADMEGVIRGRARPTSLASFTKDRPLAPGQRRPRDGRGVKVTVKPGMPRYFKNAFLVPLRSGNDGSTNNLGLAVRSETAPRGAYKPMKLGKNLWLLYGPSISQVLYSARNEARQGGVAGQISPELERRLRDEFERLMKADI